MTGRGETVRDIGEFGLIDALTASLPVKARAARRLIAGIGDDAAVWTGSKDEATLVTTDSLIEGVHFRLDWTDWTSLGWKSLAVNVSDIAAMGGVPKLATISLGLRGSERLDDLRALYQGMGELAVAHDLVIAGGDIVSSPGAFGVHVTVLGTTRDGGRYLARSGARLGDVVAVSGTLGASAAGLRLLRERPDSPRRQATTADLMIAAHLRPEPRVLLGRALLNRGATAEMDLSDGLFGDLPKILAASGVAARLDASAIPVAAALRALFPDDWFDLATRGGEDYELLFTAPRAAFDQIRRDAGTIGSTVTAIGEIVARDKEKSALVMRRPDGADVVIEAGAFDHFGERGMARSHS